MTHASKHPLFIEIMGSKTYTTQALEGSPLRGEKQETTLYEWRNQNKLLHEPIIEGIVCGKTGWTPNAGSCLAEIYSHDEINLSVVLA